MKQSCIVKGVIETNQIRGKNLIVILSNTTVAHFEVLFAVSLAETLFSFFLFSIQGEKVRKNNVRLYDIVKAYTCTKAFYDNFVLTIFTFTT